jgi:hypothetical protein
MALYDRLLGRDDLGNPVSGKVPIHYFQAAVALWAKGKITGAQAQAIAEATSGLPFDSGEVTELQALVATVPTGSTTALKADRALRLQEIDQILLLVEVGMPPLDTPAKIKIALGV